MTAYEAWRGMKRRCTDDKHPQWKNYGGRGISIKYNSLEEFIADVGERPPGLTIDRIDNDGHYEPGNCRWATRAEQQRNRRNPAVVAIEGKQYRTLDLIEKYGWRHDTITKRAKMGLPFAEVVAPERRRDLSGLALGVQAFVEKKHQQTHCCRGHEFTPENTYITPEGWRNCRMCACLKMRKRYASARKGQP